MGQMASLNGVSVRALHHYQDMGILDPIYVDPESNRRFYDIRQSAKIDLIQQLQSIGCSLDEIAELSHGGTVEDIRQAIERHLADIDERAAQLRQSRRTAQALMEGCAELSGNPMLNQILMERLPERRIISFDLGDDIRVDATSDLMEWERATRRTKRLFLEANLPVSLFHDLGSIISLESVQAASPFSARTFVAVDESRGELYDQAEVLPGGTYLTLYFDQGYDEEGHDVTYEAVLRMADYAGAKGLSFVGDFFTETLCRFPRLLTGSGEALFRICAPVEYVIPPPRCRRSWSFTPLNRFDNEIKTNLT